MTGQKTCDFKGCFNKHYAKGYCEKHYANNARHGSPEPPSRSKKIEFEVNSGGCFICTSHTKNKDGYPIFAYGGKSWIASRFVYTEMFGEISEGLVIRHKCDTRSCINPEHIETGTQKQNVDDAVERNRISRGSNRPNALLDDEQVKEIKQRIMANERGRDIAGLFGVNEKIISNIKHGRRWRHIPFPKEESK